MSHEIRKACLMPAESWERPNGAGIREVLRLAGLSGGAAALALGLGQGGDRTARRWTGDDVPIPYSGWAVLCCMAGLGHIWEER